MFNFVRISSSPPEGQFEVEVPEPTIVSSGARYQIRATAIDGSERSTTEITLRQQ